MARAQGSGLYMLTAAREYRYLRYIKSSEGDRPVLDKVVQAYMKFVHGGLG